MNVVPLNAQTGRETGKGASRRLRVQGKLPATVYGLDLPAMALTIDRTELRKALTTAAGVNALIELRYDSESQYTLVKEIQRHPVRRDPIHLDLQRIDPEQPMGLTVPIVITGEAKQVTSNGGMIDQTMTALPVSVRPDSIPNQLTADISHMELDHHHTITVGDLNLPAGVTTDMDPSSPVVVASLTRAAMVAARSEAAAAAGEEYVDDDAGTAESSGSDTDDASAAES